MQVDKSYHAELIRLRSEHCGEQAGRASADLGRDSASAASATSDSSLDMRERGTVEMSSAQFTDIGTLRFSGTNGNSGSSGSRGGNAHGENSEEIGVDDLPTGGFERGECATEVRLLHTPR